MTGHPHRSVALLAATAAFTLLMASAAASNSTRISRGDAQAVFNAALSGGAAIRLHGRTIHGPAAGAPEDGVRINAFAPWDGRHYCELDWHVISINLATGNLPGESRSRREISEELAADDVAYFLDGAALAVERTPVKRVVDSAPFVEAWYFTAGQVVDPETIAVGQHTLRIVVSDPGGVIADSQIMFFVDPAGGGACL